MMDEKEKEMRENATNLNENVLQPIFQIIAEKVSYRIGDAVRKHESMTIDEVVNVMTSLDLTLKIPKIVADTIESGIDFYSTELSNMSGSLPKDKTREIIEETFWVSIFSSGIKALASPNRLEDVLDMILDSLSGGPDGQTSVDPIDEILRETALNKKTYLVTLTV